MTERVYLMALGVVIDCSHVGVGVIVAGRYVSVVNATVRVRALVMEVGMVPGVL